MVEVLANALVVIILQLVSIKSTHCPLKAYTTLYYISIKRDSDGFISSTAASATVNPLWRVDVAEENGFT